MSDLQEVIERLPHLSTSDLVAVKARILFLLQSGVSKPAEESTDELVILESISSVLASMGLEFPEVHFLKKSRSYPSFRDKVPALMKYFSLAGLNRSELRGLLTISTRLLIADMQGIGLQVTARTLLAHIHRLPGVVNLAFPDYAASGMLGMIVRTRRIDHENNRVSRAAALDV